jgi:plastocyanin
MTHRRAAALGMILVLGLVVVPVLPVAASGGGGCGGPITSDGGTEIAIEGFCFTPTVLYADPGDTVTWTNKDGLKHNVAGANMAWGSYEALRTNRSASYLFSKAGVYSYVCTMHPGMVGTVVIGNPTVDNAPAADSVRRIKHVSAVQDAPVEPAQTSDRAALWLTTAAIVVITGLLVLGRRVGRRRHS